MVQAKQHPSLASYTIRFDARSRLLFRMKRNGPDYRSSDETEGVVVDQLVKCIRNNKKLKNIHS